MHIARVSGKDADFDSAVGLRFCIFNKVGYTLNIKTLYLMQSYSNFTKFSTLQVRQDSHLS